MSAIAWFRKLSRPLSCPGFSVVDCFRFARHSGIGTIKPKGKKKTFVTVPQLLADALRECILSREPAIPGGQTPTSPRVAGTPQPPKPKRYHGTVTLESARVGRDAGRIADEVVTHIVGLVGSSVKITLEIEAQIPGGVPDNVVRTVTENSRALKFTSSGFEKE
jgi:hypothetical protein